MGDFNPRIGKESRLIDIAGKYIIHEEFSVNGTSSYCQRVKLNSDSEHS